MATDDSARGMTPVRMGKFLLLDRIHVGGLAEVFVAKPLGITGLETAVAIKRIQSNIAADEEFITHFLDEARICVQLSHANIVHLHEVGKEGDTYFIAMELVAGQNVRGLLDYHRRRKEQMSISQAVFIASKLCEGLDYAHRKQDAAGRSLGIVHRAVAPENVLVSYEGAVKIIDFGTAKASNRLQQTQIGVHRGKLGYMSPEQLLGEDLDRRCDIFGVGVLLYEMLTGHSPFAADSEAEALDKVIRGQVASPCGYNPFIPDELESIVMRMLSRDPNQRQAWASDVQDELLPFLVESDSVYSSKHLALFMKDAYRDTLQRESERLAELMKAEPPPEHAAKTQQRKSGEAVIAPLPSERSDWGDERTQLVSLEQLQRGLPKIAPPPAPVAPPARRVSAERKSVPNPVPPSDPSVTQAEPYRWHGMLDQMRERPGPWLGGAAMIVAIWVASMLWPEPTSNVAASEILVRLVPAVDAKVTVGGRLVKVDKATPFPAGEYDLVAMAQGYKAHSQRIKILPNEPRAEFTVLLETERGRPNEPARDKPKVVEPPDPAKKPRTFVANFSTPHEGVEVWVDGRSYGKTPKVRAPDLVVGRVYRFAARRPGYKVAEGQFSSSGEAEVTVSLSLDTPLSPPPKPTPKKMGRLVCNSEPEGAAIWVDGAPTGRRTPIRENNPLLVPPGKRTIVFRMAGMESAPQTVTVQENAVTKIPTAEINREADPF